MANRELKITVIIDGKKATTVLKRVDASIDETGRSAEKASPKVKRLGRIMETAFGNAIARAVGKLTSLIGSLARGGIRLLNDSVRLAGIQQIADRKLEQAIRNTGAATEEWLPRLKEAAADLQRLSNFGDEQIQTAQALLLSFREVGGPQGAELLTARLADVAAGLAKTGEAGVDLNTVAQAIGRALTGGVGALTRYGISLSEAQKQQFKTAEGMDRVRLLSEVLDDNFKGLAQATADPFKQMENAASDAQEVLGKELRPELAGLARDITTFLQDPSTKEGIKNLGRGIIATVRLILSLFATSGGVMLNMRSAVQRTVAASLEGYRAMLVALRDTKRAFGLGTEGVQDHIDTIEAAVRVYNRFADENSEKASGALQLAKDLLRANGELAQLIAENETGGGGGVVGGDEVEKAVTALGKAQEALRELKTELQDLESTDLTVLTELTRQADQLERRLRTLRAIVEAASRPQKVEGRKGVHTVEVAGELEFDQTVKSMGASLRTLSDEAETEADALEAEYKDALDNMGSDFGAFVRRSQAHLDAFLQAFSVGIDTIRGIASNLHQGRLQEIELERRQALASIDARLSREGLSEKRREALVQQRENAQAQFEQRRLEAVQKQAALEKKLSLFKIAIETAENIVEAFPNVFKIAAAVVLGAAQAAVVASQPIPKLARGATNFKGGSALVGERGPELVTLPRGSNVLTNANTRAVVGAMGAAASSRGGINEARLAHLIAKEIAKMPAPLVDVADIESGLARRSRNNRRMGLTNFD